MLNKYSKKVGGFLLALLLLVLPQQSAALAAQPYAQEEVYADLVLEAATPPGNMKLSLRDSETGKELCGAYFKLQKKNEEGVFEDTGRRSMTNLAGQLFFDELEQGNYKVVETKALKGYDINSAHYFHRSTFTISETNVSANVHCTNTKVWEEPAPAPLEL